MSGGPLGLRGVWRMSRASARVIRHTPAGRHAQAALAQAESLGGKRLMGPVDPTPEITIGQFADPEGNVIGVVNSAM